MIQFIEAEHARVERTRRALAKTDKRRAIWRNAAQKKAVFYLDTRTLEAIANQ